MHSCGFIATAPIIGFMCTSKDLSKNGHPLIRFTVPLWHFKGLVVCIAYKYKLEYIIRDSKRHIYHCFDVVVYLLVAGRI